MAPAITILDAGVGTLDGLLSASQGSITAAQSTGNQTLSRAALQGVGPTVNISIASDAITFNALSSSLKLQTGTGDSAAFTTTTGAISFADVTNTVTTAGASLTFGAGTNLTVARLNTNGGDASLTAGTAGAGNLQFGNVLTSGSGNITAQATNAAGGTVTQSGSAVGQAINVTATGNVVVDSLRGTTVDLTSDAGSISSAGANAVQASAELTINAATGVTLNTLAASLQATNSTGGNIGITQLASPAQTLTITGTGVVNNAIGGSVSITNLGASVTVSAAGDGVLSNNGVVTLAGTDLQINGPVNSGTARTILTSVGGPIDLAANTPGTVGLTQSELNEVTAGVLQIGDPAAGPITIRAAITNPASWNTLALVNNAGVKEAAAGSLTLPNLRVSSAGPVALNSVNNVQNLSGSVGGSGNGFAINDGTNTLTIPNAGVDGVLGLTTNNGNIDLVADNILIRQVITPGTGTVILQPFTQTLNITLGTASAPGTTFGITNGGLGWITSGVTQVGVAADTGSIAITGAINRTPTSTAPSRSQTLSLITGNTGANPNIGSTTGAVTQTAALSVANLAVRAIGGVQLTNASNNVDQIAGSVTGTGNFTQNFRLVDAAAGALTVGTVDGVAGITVGPEFLEITTTHGLTLTNGLTGLNIGLSALGAVTQGAGASAAILGGAGLGAVEMLGNGPYTLTNPNNTSAVIAAAATNAVSYTSAGPMFIGGLTYIDGFGGTVDGVTTFNAAISLTTVDGALTVAAAGPVNAGAGAVSLTAGTPAGQNRLLDIEGAVTGSGGVTLTADNMSVGAAVNAGTAIARLQPFSAGQAINLGGADAAGTLGLTQSELNQVTAGVLRIGNLSNSGNITVTAAITDVGTGWNTLSLLTGSGAGISQNVNDTLTVTNLNVAGNTGVKLDQDNVVSTLAGATESGTFTFVDIANLTVDNVDSGLGNGFGSGIITQAQAVSLIVFANDSLTVNQQIDTTHSFDAQNHSGGANISLDADNMALNNNGSHSTINAGTGGVLSLAPFIFNNTIAVGGPDAAGQLGIDDNDLSNVTAGVVRIGGIFQTGAVTVDGTINRHAGFNSLDLSAANGAITQTTGSISVANLALQAANGIGSGGLIQVVGLINLAFDNTSSNNVQVHSTGALTVNSVDGVATSANQAAAGTVTLTASSPLTVAVNMTSGGTISLTTTETGSETGTPLPPPDDDITVNANVTVESTGGDVVFTSGDGITTGAGGLLKSDTGAVNLKIGVGDNDNDATLSIGGSVSGDVNYTASGDIVLDTLFPNGLNDAGHTVTLTSTGGAILDSTNPADAGDETDITAGTIHLNAAKGIGTVADPIVIQAGTLSFGNSASGDVNIVNVSGKLSASGSNSASGGRIDVTVQGAALKVNAGNLTSTNGAITLGADSMTLTGTVNAGTGVVTLKPTTGGRAIDLGTNGDATHLGLLQTDLNQVTAGVLRVGDLIAAGAITITADITDVGTGFTTLSLLSGGTVSEGGNTITVTSLAVQGDGNSGFGVDLNAANAVTNIAGTTAGFFGFRFADSLATVNIATVDGVQGIDGGTGGASVDLLTTGATLNVNQAVSASNPGDAQVGVGLTADNININAAISAANGVVSLAANDDSRTVTLGTKPGTSLGLTQTELNRITAGTGLTFSTNTGGIQITAAITDATAGWSTLALKAVNSTLTQGSGDTLTVTTLLAEGDHGVTLTENNSVADLQGVMTAGPTFSFFDGSDLTVAALPRPLNFSANGISGNTGETVNITLAANHLLTINSPIDTTLNGIFKAGGNVNLLADSMNINAAINGGTNGRVRLDVSTSLRSIVLGPKTGHVLSLTNAELGLVSAGVLQIGDPNADVLSIEVAASITQGGWNTLELLASGGSVIADSGASVSVPNLVALGRASVSLTDPGNNVTTLAGIAEGGSAFDFVDSTSLTVGTVDAGLPFNFGVGVQTVAAGPIRLTVLGSGNSLTVDDAVDATAGGLNSVGGAVTLTADAMTLNAVVNGGTAGVVTLDVATAGRAIDLGGAGSGARLTLTQAELNEVSGAVLRVGDLVNTGDIAVTAAITAPATWKTLSLLTGTGGGVSQTSGSTLTVANFQAAGQAGVALNEKNVVGTLAGAANAGAAFSFVDTTSLTVGSVDAGLGAGFGVGIITGGPVSLTVQGRVNSLTVSQPIDTEHFSAVGSDVTLVADLMTLSAGVNAGATGAVTLKPFLANTNIELGGPKIPGDQFLILDDSDFGQLTAGVVRVGSTAQTASITVQENITRHAGYDTLDLIAAGSGGTVGADGGSVDVANLALRADAGIGAGDPFGVVGPINVAFDNLTSGKVVISSTGALTIAAVDGVNVSANHAAAGTVTLSAASPMTYAVNVTSGATITATTTETADESASPPEDDITVNAGVTVESTGGNVVFTSADGIITQSGGVLKSDSGAVNLTAGMGDNDNDAVLTLNGSINAVNVTLSSPGDIGVSGITATGTVRLTSTNGSIIEGLPDPAGVDITATNLELSAAAGVGGSTGVGVGADGELETQVSHLTAQTATGGIFISNTGALTIGFSGDAVHGVEVTGASGDIVLTNAGTVTVNSAADNVEASNGTVTINATGAASDVLVSRGIVAGNAAVSVSITAGQDVIVDDFGAISAFSSALANAVTVSAGRNITLQATTTPGAIIASNTGNVTLTTGAGGVFTNNAGTDGGVLSVGGDIIISADDMVINDSIDASDFGAAAPGVVTLQQTGATTRDIDLGGGTTAGDLGLSDAEMGQVTASVLRIGRTDNAGNLTVTAPVTTHAGYDTLSLLTGGGVFEAPGSGGLTVTSLAVQAANNVGLDVNPSAVSNLAVSGFGVGLLDSLSLTVTTVDGVTGVSSTGVLLLKSTVANTSLTVSQPVTTNGFNDITLLFDNMNLAAAVDAAGRRVTLEPFSSGQLIDIGGPDAVGTLGLDGTDLGNVTASTVQIGDSTSSDVTVSNAVTLTNVATLDLETGGAVIDGNTTEPDVTVANLALRTGAGVSLDTGVSNLAFVNTGGAVSIRNVGGIDEVQQVSVSGSSGSFTLSFNGASTAALPFDATAAQVRDALDALPTVGGVGGAVAVTQSGAVYAVVFGGNLADQNLPLMTGTASGGAGLVTTTLTDGSGPLTSGTDEVQQVSVSGSSGSFTLSFNGASTAALPFDATAAQVRDALDALPTVGGVGGAVAVTQSGSAYTVIFGGSLAHQNLPLMTGTASGGAGLVTTTLTDGSAPQSLTITGVDGIGASSNTGTTTTLSDGSPITFAVNMISAGTISVTTAETPVETDNPPEDDITVNAGVTVESTGGDVDFTAGDGVTIAGTVTSDSGAVNLSIGVGDDDNDAVLTVTGTINAATVTFTAPGDIILDDLPSSITNRPGQTVSITSTGGAILDSTNPADHGDDTDVTAANLALSAATGIGTAADNIVTAVSAVAAFNKTGGIFLSNTGDLSIGFAGDVNFTQGVVDNVTGDVQITNAGTVDVTDSSGNGSEEVFARDGNISIKATGTNSDILTGGGETAVETLTTGANGLHVTLQAGRDITLGSGGQLGDVISDGDLTMTAGRNITVESGSSAIADGPGGVTATALGDISVLGTVSNISSAASGFGPGGPVALTTGVGHVFTLNASFGGVYSSSAVTVSADDIVLADPTETVNAGSGVVTLQQATGGVGATTRNIDLGLGTTAGDLGLSDAELGQITAGVLRIGRSDNAGTITVTGPVTAHAGYTTLTLLSGGTITESGTGAITVANLDVHGTGVVDLTTNASTVGKLSGRTTVAGAAFSFTNSTGFTVDTVDLDGGIQTSGGVIDLTAQGAGDLLTVNQPITAGNADVDLTADDLAINAAVSAGTQTVTLSPVTSGRKIDLGGGTTANELGLSDAELAELTAGVLHIGGATAGDITLTGDVTAHAGYNTLHLFTGGGVVETVGTLTVTNLAISASAGIGSAGALLTAVGNLAFSNLAAGAVQISNTGQVTIKAIDGILTSANQGGATVLSTVGALVFAVNTTSAGALTATANESGSGSDDLVVNPGVEVFSAVAHPGDLVLRAGDNLIVHTGGNLQTPNGGNIILDIGFNDNDGDGSAGSVIQGLLISDSITVNGGPGPNVLLLDFANGAALPFRGLTYNGGASGHDVLKISDAGSAVGHTYALSPGAVVRSLAAPIAFNNLSLVTIDAGDASDTFNVSPSPTTTFTVNGGLPTPPALPGDELNLNLAGVANPVLTKTGGPTGYSGAWTFGNAQPVNFAGIETLNPDSGAVVVTGGGVLVVNATNSNSGSYTLDGGAPVSFVNATSFTFNGGVSMTVNNPPGGLFAPAGGVFDNGKSSTSDILVVQGGAAVSETFDFTPNSADGGHNGDFTLTGTGGPTAFYAYTEFSAVNQVEVNAGAPQSLVFNLPNNALDNQITFVPAALGQVQLRSRDGGFETTFASYATGASVTVNAAGSVGQTLDVQPLPGAVVVINGGGDAVLNFDATGTPTGTPTGGFTSGGVLEALYSGVRFINLNGASGVDAIYGPDTADRATAFTGLSAEERFVQALYLDALGRAGTKAELDAWVSVYDATLALTAGHGATDAQARAVAQGMVAADIEHSAEGRDHLVKTWYETFLGRAAVGGEEQSFVNVLLTGQTEEQVLSTILSSAEFNNRAQTLVGGTGTADQNFVEALYRLLLNRPSGGGEGAAFVAALASQGRQGVARDFLTSAEFRTGQFEGYYNALLHRPSDPNNLDPTGLNGWVMSNLDVGTVRLGFEASPEFFSNG